MDDYDGKEWHNKDNNATGSTSHGSRPKTKKKAPAVENHGGVPRQGPDTRAGDSNDVAAELAG